MIEMAGMHEEEIGLFLEWLARRNRHVAFEGARVVSQGGIGHLAIPAEHGPFYQGRRIVTVGAKYRLPKVDLGRPCCPHFATGEIVTGAPDIVFEGVPVVMFGDKGEHWPGCGTASVFVAEGWRRMVQPRDRWDFSQHARSGGFTISAGDDPDALELPGKPAPAPMGAAGGGGMFTIRAGDDPAQVAVPTGLFGDNITVRKDD